MSSTANDNLTICMDRAAENVAVYPPQAKARAREYYRKGYSLKHIAEETGVKYGTVRSWASDGRWSREPQEEGQAEEEKRDTVTLEEAQEMARHSLEAWDGLCRMTEPVLHQLRQRLRADEVLPPRDIRTAARCALVIRCIINCTADIKSLFRLADMEAEEDEYRFPDDDTLLTGDGVFVRVGSEKFWEQAERLPEQGEET